jgi:signal transduction histidine kinase
MDRFETRAEAEKGISAPEINALSGMAGAEYTCGILAVDNERRICALNKQAEQLVGLSVEQALNQPMGVLPEPIQHLIRAAAEASEQLPEQHLKLSAESPRILQVSSLKIAGQAGFSGVILVLTELRSTHPGIDVQRLDRLASIGTLAAGMAHEIKNALVAVKTFADDLLQRNRDAELAGLVSREIRRVDAIVSQMLRFAGPGKPTFLRISLHRILEHSLRLLQPQLEQKQIRLRRSFTAHPDLVNGDSYQLEQVFLNLFLNAAAAMSTQGRLSVSTETLAPQNAGAGEESQGPTVQVTISDNGPGIAPEVLARLFEPFFTTKPQGTGLGLSITRRIVIAHGGKISVESQPGQGATFKVLMPLSGSPRTDVEMPG